MPGITATTDRAGAFRQTMLPEMTAMTGCARDRVSDSAFRSVLVVAAGA